METLSNQESDSSKVGVLLINFGGPDQISDVKPFLYNLFSDPQIINLPIKFLQKPLAWLIATTRRKKSEGYYKKIGGGSPQKKLTQDQARDLIQELKKNSLDIPIYIGMVCWHPLLEEAVNQIITDKITHLIVLPLFPHFSMTTTGSATKKLVSIFDRYQGLRGIRRSYVTHYEEHPLYIQALAEMTMEEMRKFPDPRPDSMTLLFSAHSIPQKYIQKGDPYLKQTQKTVEKVMASIHMKMGKVPRHVLSFQSKVGPVKWLEPSTDATLRRLASEGEKQVLVIPVSFVSEHIETLYELDILYKELAEEIQLPNFRRVGALNCHPLFIRSLAKLITDCLKRDEKIFRNPGIIENIS